MKYTNITKAEAITLVGSEGRLPMWGYVLLTDGKQVHGTRGRNGWTFRLAE